MTTEKSKNQIDNLIADIDKNQDYEKPLSDFIKDVNRILQIPIRVSSAEFGTKGEEYTLSYLLSNPKLRLGYDLEPLLEKYKGELENPTDWNSYTATLSSFLNELAGEVEVSGSQGNFTLSLFVPDVTLGYVDEIKDNVFNWNITSTETQTFGPENQKVLGLSVPPAEKIDPETGEFFFQSRNYYTGPNIPIDENDFYVDGKTGELKLDSNGNPIRPHFRRGSAAALFEGLSSNAIFEIQQELFNLGLDPSSYDFVPGVINFSAKGNEIDFVAMLMTQANDDNFLMPSSGLIDKNAPSLWGQLTPYLSYAAEKLERTNVLVEGLEQYGSEVLPPTEAEVKAVVDELFAEKGIYATARDYEKYAGIFSNLQKDAAARQVEIEKNKPTLSEVIGLSTLNDTGTAPTQIGPYTYGGFDLMTPTPEQARKQLGKPLLQPIDVRYELGKIVDDLEAGRIDASQELSARSAAAVEFKRNFMQFEENF